VCITFIHFVYFLKPQSQHWFRKIRPIDSEEGIKTLGAKIELDKRSFFARVHAVKHFYFVTDEEAK
jgi:hypothetical protein